MALAIFDCALVPELGGFVNFDGVIFGEKPVFNFVTVCPHQRQPGRTAEAVLQRQAKPTSIAQASDADLPQPGEMPRRRLPRTTIRPIAIPGPKGVRACPDHAAAPAAAMETIVTRTAVSATNGR